MDVRSRLYLCEDPEAAKDYVCTKASQLAPSNPVLLNSPAHDTIRNRTNGKEIYSSTKSPERGRLQKRIPDRAVTIATDVNPSDPQLLKPPNSITTGYGVRRAATTHGDPTSKSHEKSMQTSTPVSQETLSPISTSAGDGDPSQKLLLVKKGGFLRTLNKLDFIGKSKSMVTMRNHQTETSLFERLSQRISGEDHPLSGSSTVHEETRWRPTATSSSQTETCGLEVSDMNISGISTDKPDACAGRSPKDHHDNSHVVLPYKPFILVAKVDIVPELGRLEMDAEPSMWVAVDITADVFRPEGEPEVSDPEPNALDVVVCFDPS